MSQSKRQKMDLNAACSSASVNTQEMMSTSVQDNGGESHIAEQTARADYRAEYKERTIFDMSLSSFREAVKWSAFVDRSLLIKELLSETDARIVIIFAPRRFGKSMNLNMVECFLEIEGDRDVTNAPQDLKELENFENFKAFQKYEMEQPCKILAETDLVREHFGRHPVLHMTFKSVHASSIQDVKDSLKSLVKKAYLAHSYLRYSNSKIFSDSDRNEDANKTCRMWCDLRDYKKEDAIGGLQKLIEYLHAYHNRKVYLLVDEFDAPAVHALLRGRSGDEVRNINNQVTELLGAVVKGPIAERHLLGSLITGVTYLGSIGISDNLNNVPAYKWQLDDRGRFAPYYGLSHNELVTIFERVFPHKEQEETRDSILKEVKNLYNGYSFQDESVYCLWSVLHYIDLRSRLDVSKIWNVSFWGNSSIILDMVSLLKNSDLMIKIMNMIGGDCISFTPCEKVDAQVFANFLKRCEFFESNDLVFSFFLEQGYVTRVLDQSENVYRPDDAIRVKIPNKEVLFVFRNMFRQFSEVNCGLCSMEMTECAEVFKHLPKDRDDEILKEKLSDFYKHLKVLLRRFIVQEGANKRSLQAALYTTMLKTRFKECSMEKCVEIDTEIVKIDLWFNDYNNFAIIFEIKFIESDNDDIHKKSAQQALEKILSGSKTKKVPYVKILDEYSNIKNYLLIGMSMSGKCKPYMCCLANSRNDKDCIFLFPEDN